ncbi:HofO family protein [Tatumella citrea]|uniref:DNA utilization protein HofO C-terminal domain-containing protein n=1 Tax=Tatumella citrea TaxID=53336 RepID=A0A1Y0L301_TATCI|nr:hypothetical protein [Tatumella citrea]ARU92383.1 hypothetical protein A7K98_00360 [Tatumella citrea]ARU96418.1 hypothetical protein A7K99_00360 [Tatumella citrea]
MNDLCLSLLFRPPRQQWMVFSFLSAVTILIAYFMAILPEWQRYQHSEQQYLQQRIALTRQREQFVQLAAPEEQRALCQSASEVQRVTPGDTLEQLLAASQRKVKRWRNGIRPVELQLELQWPDVSEFFRQMAQLNPPLLPGRFSLEYQSESEGGLQMAMWLNRHE